MATERRPDPLSILTQSMRRMADLRLDDITRGLENFANPSARGMLDSLGRTRDEQIENLAAMLRNSSEDEIAEMAQIFGEAMAKLAEERATGAPPTAGRTASPSCGPPPARGAPAARPPPSAASSATWPPNHSTRRAAGIAADQPAFLRNRGCSSGTQVDGTGVVRRAAALLCRADSGHGFD